MDDRDESRDVWLMRYGLNQLETAIAKGEPRTVRVLPEADQTYSRIGYVRYSPHNKLAQLRERLVRVETAARALIMAMQTRATHPTNDAMWPSELSWEPHIGLVEVGDEIEALKSALSPEAKEPTKP